MNRPGPVTRRLRGWLYRRIPGFWPGGHRRRAIGHGRRWNAEEEGKTWEGFCRIFWERVLARRQGGIVFELSAGDGLVGSLGNWLETRHGWRAECWEPKEEPAAQLRRHRPASRVHARPDEFSHAVPDLVTARSTRSARLTLRQMEAGRWRPAVLAIWNRRGEGHWARRVGPLGYRLVFSLDRFEIYQRKGLGNPGSGFGSQGLVQVSDSVARA